MLVSFYSFSSILEIRKDIVKNLIISAILSTLAMPLILYDSYAETYQQELP